MDLLNKYADIKAQLEQELNLAQKQLFQVQGAYRLIIQLFNEEKSRIEKEKLEEKIEKAKSEIEITNTNS